MIDFMIRLGGVVSELHRLLTIRFVLGSRGNDTQIGRQIASLIPLWNAGRTDLCQIELLRLEFLVKHLREIEEADTSLLVKFRIEFRRCGNSPSYFGIRFEVYVAASLIRKGVRFKKSETPDFLITDTYLGLECTSTRVISANKKEDLTYKITAAIAKKAKTASNVAHNALLIDVTNLAFNSSQLEIDAIRSAAASYLDGVDFGAVLLFIYMFNPDFDRYEANYVRVDSKTIIASLKSLLDQIFPVTGHRVYSWQYPVEG